MSPRIVPCETCQTEGFLYRAGPVYEPGCGHAHMGEICIGLCPDCQGAGCIEVEATPISYHHLDEIDIEGCEP